MTEPATRRPDAAAVVGILLVVGSALLYWLCARAFDSGRGDFFYLADAFLHGRTWLDFQPSPWDVIVIDGRSYVPFGPFPAIALLPVVAVLSAVTADQLESGINAILAAGGVGLCWMLLGRVGVPRLVDRWWLTVLFGFSTQILWITTRGGVWHTGQLVATVMTFAALVELWGRKRAWLVGLLAGAAFLARAPLLFAIPFYGLMLDERPYAEAAQTIRGHLADAARSVRWRRWAGLALGVLPAIVFFFAYNAVRFGNPLESGYALASLSDRFESHRAQGLFALVHVPMNLDYLFFHLPGFIDRFPFFKPDGLGMSVLITSPGLLFAVRADWRRPRAWWLAGATIAVLVPTLLYYGGGWLQYGYRYFLDSVPFVMALCGVAAAYRGSVGPGWKVLIVFGTLVMAFGVYWAYRL